MKKIIYLCELLLFVFFLTLLIFLKSKLSLILGIPLIVLIYLISKKIKIKHFSIFIFLVALLIRLISVFYFKIEIADDFKTMLEASKLMISGNLSFVKNPYFLMFPYQLGHVIYQALLLKVINSIVFLKIINSVVTSLIVLFIYKISKELFNEEISKTISLAYILYFYPLYLNSVLTNQHIPALLSLIVIYFMITKKLNYKYSLIIGIILSLANILRTESIIFIIGITIYNLITINKKNYKHILKCTSIMLVVYFIMNIIISQLILISPMNTKLKNNAPKWKFYCGLNYKYNGIYNEEDQNMFFNSNNQDDLLKERIKTTNIKLPVLFLKKELILWTQTNYDLRITNNINTKIKNIILYINQGYLNILIILFTISLFPTKKKEKKEFLLLKIIIGLYIGIYMLIEISPRYAYILHILMFLLLGFSINRISKYYDIIRKKR